MDTSAAQDRIHGVDLARGLAVVGMYAAHVVATAPALVWTDPSTWNVVVHGNSSILFATLAGISLGLVTGGSAPHRDERLARDRRRVAVRAGLIFTLGIALWLLPMPVYVILPAYGILFLIAIALLGRTPTWLFAFAGGVAVISPFVVLAVNGSDYWMSGEGRVVSAVLGWHYPFLAWIAFVAAGLALARIGFSRTGRILSTGGVAAAVSAVGFALVGPNDHPALTSEPHQTGVGEMLGSGGLAIAIVCACVLVCRTPATWILWPLRAVGSMPLTAYTAQLVAWSVWIWAQDEPVGLDHFQALHPFWPLTIATIVGCSLWKLVIGPGPLEWLLGRAARAAAR